MIFDKILVLYGMVCWWFLFPLGIFYLRFIEGTYHKGLKYEWNLYWDNVVGEWKK